MEVYTNLRRLRAFSLDSSKFHSILVKKSTFLSLTITLKKFSSSNFLKSSLF